MSYEHSPARDGSVPQVQDRIIGEPECEQITDLSRTTRWRLMQKGRFPKKVRLSDNRSGWHFSQVLQWLSEREAV